jgi:GNAT superfamily N-acetyltransferase
MSISTIDGFDPGLDAIARESRQATFYHTGTWLESLAAAFPRLTLKCLTSGDGHKVAYLPFFVAWSRLGEAHWSLPFGTYGGPVGDPALCSELLGAFVSRAGTRGVREVGMVDFSGEIDLPEFSIEPAQTHVLELDQGFEKVWARFDRSKRRQTRKAKREGIEVAEASSVEEVIAYHRIYSDKAKQWHLRTHYPERLFVNLFEAGRGNVRLFLARLDGEILGGHLNFYFRDTVTAWNGVTTDDARGHQAGTALYSACIRHACDNGYDRYNLGASLGKQSLESYKQDLGGVVHQYRVLRWRSLRGRIASTIRKALPGH